jgi:hypothetical protein
MGERRPRLSGPAKTLVKAAAIVPACLQGIVEMPFAGCRQDDASGEGKRAWREQGASREVVAYRYALTGACDRAP